jgi:hypothetical protein
MRTIFSLVTFFCLTTTAFAQCGAGGNFEFDARTERGFSNGKSIIAKLEKEQCGFVALWIPAAIVDLPANAGCKFGQVWTVSGNETKPVPSGGPFTGNMLVVTKQVCKN